MSDDGSPPSAWPVGLKGEIDQRPRRFYTRADVSALQQGWGVTLDGRPLRTPAGKPLAVPVGALAREIAHEWESQSDRIDLLGMFATRLANVAIDRTPLAREAIADEVAKYATTDLVCYVAQAPAGLRDMQHVAWTPHREWAATHLGVTLHPAEGIAAIDQPPESLQAVRRQALDCDDFRLSALVFAAGLFGSAVLALAVLRSRLSAADAFEASRIEERYQQDRWGVDAEAAAMLARRRSDAAALDRWFAALQAG